MITQEKNPEYVDDYGRNMPGQEPRKSYQLQSERKFYEDVGKKDAE